MKENRFAQRILAEAEETLERKIVTPILPALTFNKAEDYLQDYYKSDNRVLTRSRYIKQSAAYKNYGKWSGRDVRALELWGDQAAFAKFHQTAFILLAYTRPGTTNKCVNGCFADKLDPNKQFTDARLHEDQFAIISSTARLNRFSAPSKRPNRWLGFPRDAKPD